MKTNSTRNERQHTIQLKVQYEWECYQAFAATLALHVITLVHKKNLEL